MTVVGLLLAVLIFAQPAGESDAVDEVRAAVERGIQQLDAAKIADRRWAERELLDLGPKILRWLPPPELIRGAESKDAVDRIRIQLQRKLAQESARSSRVTLTGEFSLDDLIAEIARQTGNPLQIGKDLPETARHTRAWSFDNATFWDALEEVCRATELAPVADPDSEGLQLALRPNDRHAAASCRVGVLRAELEEAKRQPVAGDPTRMLIRLKGELAFEPRLRPLFVHFKAGDFSATDGDGTPLETWNPLARYELPMAGASRRTQLTWDFVAPANAVPNRIALKGRLLVQLAAATEPIRFEQLTTRKEILRRRGGVSVRLHQAEFADAGNEAQSGRVTITVSYDAGGPAFESHRTWVYHNAAWLEDARRRYPYSDFDTLLQTDGSVRLEYRFADLPRDAALKFVYEAPTLLLDVPFDIAFDDVKVK